jgi:transposase
MAKTTKRTRPPKKGRTRKAPKQEEQNAVTPPTVSTPPTPTVETAKEATTPMTDESGSELSCVCGLDVHSTMIMACLWTQPPGKRRAQKEVRQFGTNHADLVELKQWLLAHGCQQVGMESTGVYWYPIFNELEGSLDVWVGNARHLRNVPARKTDVKDSEWLAELLFKGFFKKSFIPEAPFRELRKLVRFRHNLVEARTEERNLILKHLESAGIKLANVASDVFGVTGMRILHALAEGTTSPEEMADLAVKGLRKKLGELVRALETNLSPTDRWVLKQQLKRLARHEADVEEIETQLKSAAAPYEKELALLDTIPGVSFIAAVTLVAELGVDLKAFANEHRLSAWAGLAPGNNISNGKPVGRARRHGNQVIVSTLVEAAWAATRTKGSYLKEKYFRLKARKSAKVAIFAIAHKLLIAAFHILTKREPYRELGAAYAERADKDRRVRQAVKVIQAHGYAVLLTPKESSAPPTPG